MHLKVFVCNIIYRNSKMCNYSFRSHNAFILCLEMLMHYFMPKIHSYMTEVYSTNHQNTHTKMKIKKYLKLMAQSVYLKMFTQ